MKHLKPLLILFFVSLLVGGCGKDFKTPEDIKTEVAFLDAEQALPQFPFGTKPFYFYFHADWCRYCKKMKYDVFERPEIIKYMNENFTCMSVMPDSLDDLEFLGDTVNIEELKEAFQFKAFPSHYFFSKAGLVQGARTGYIPLLRFKQLLKYVAEGHIDKYNFDTFLLKPESDMDTVFGEF